MPGTLYIVSTPIGNLGDMSRRAVEVLGAVQLVAAEDTRTTGVLLKHYDIHVPMTSYHAFNEARRSEELVERLQQGDSVALVSDAGTPGISDPAFRVVRSAIDAGVPVISIPGPAAFLTGLVVSGLPMERFVFEGFLPAKKGRHTRLERLKDEDRTMIFYEAPHRLLRTLRDLQETFGERPMAAARELTKKFEEVRRGTIGEVMEYFSSKAIKGEFVLVVAGKPGKRRGGEDLDEREGEDEEERRGE